MGQERRHPSQVSLDVTRDELTVRSERAFLVSVVLPDRPALGDDPLALTDREEELSTWLVEHGVEEDWLLSPVLAAAGVDVAWCDRVADLLDEDSLEPALQWVASSV